MTRPADQASARRTPDTPLDTTPDASSPNPPLDAPSRDTPRPDAEGHDEAEARLVWQAEAAVVLLQRFGAQLLGALTALGAADERALAVALAERERLLAQLAPLLAPLATARARCALGGHAVPDALLAVDAALVNARHLHVVVADEVRARTTDPALVRRARHGRAAVRRDAPLALAS